jgi:hypothetical protein
MGVYLENVQCNVGGHVSNFTNYSNINLVLHLSEISRDKIKIHLHETESVNVAIEVPSIQW